MNPKDYLSIPAFARLHGASIDAVRRAIKRGLLTTREVIGHQVIHKDAPFVRAPIGRPPKTKPPCTKSAES